MLPCLALALAMLAPAVAQSVDLVNAGFEDGSSGETPAGWTLFPEGGTSWRASLTTDDPAAGRNCAMIVSELAEDAPESVFLFQYVDAEPLRGKRVRLTARLRCERELPFGGVHLWARTTRADQRMDDHDLGRRPVRGEEWAARGLVVDVPDDATWLGVGARLHGLIGTAWVDAFELDVVGVAGEGIEGPRPLEGPALQNLVAFTKLLGYVRHFHPSDEAAAADWDSFARHGVRVVEGAASSEELARALTDLFARVAPTVQVYAGTPPALPAELLGFEGARWARGWNHLGLGRPDSTLYKSQRWKRRLRNGTAPPDLIAPDDVFEAPLARGVRCRVPLTLLATAEGTVPKAEGWVPDDASPPASGEDRSTRLAGVALAWSALQHFYPYFDVVSADWPAVLERSLERAAVDEDALAFLQTLYALLAPLEDGHAFATYDRIGTRLALPLAWEWIEGELVVTAAAPGLAVRRGDVVRAIDGVPAEAAIVAQEASSSGATAAARRFAALVHLLAGPPGTSVLLEIEHADRSTAECAVEHASLEVLSERKPPKVHEFEPGLYYVDIDRIDDDDLERVLPDLALARAIVFDLRGYPALTTLVPAFLSGERMLSPEWQIPRPARPDREGLVFESMQWPAPPGTWSLPPSVFLTNERAQSAAETVLSFVEEYELAPIVGAPSAGTNGNVNNVDLPGGFTVSFTGMRVLKQDGSRHHGVGILPTHPVERTRAGVIEGRDEVLEAALALALVGRDSNADLGAYWLGRGEYAKAVESLTAALADRGDDADLLFDRGYAHFLLEQDDEALADFAAAIAADADHAGARVWHGFVRWTRGETDAALADFDFAVATWPEDSRGHAYRGYLLFGEQRYADAAADFERVRALEEDLLGEASLYLWLIENETLDRPSADEQLRERRPAEESDLFGSLADMLLGETPESDLLELAAELDDPAALCRVRFYAAHRRLAEGDEVGAQELFRACRETRQRDLAEHWLARMP